MPQIVLLRTRKNRELIAKAVAVKTPNDCYCEVVGEQIHLSILTLPDGKTLHERIQYKWFTNHELGTWLVFVCLEDSHGNKVPSAKWGLEEMSSERKAWVRIMTPQNSCGGQIATSE